MSYELLKIVANASLGNAPTSANTTLPTWDGPDPTVVHVQSILYSSLAASLLSVFIAILGKQWLNRYAGVEMGSVVDRSRQRYRKMEGMVTWHFDLVMESLPLMLQAALLLLGYALSEYLFSINKTVAGVLIGFAASGLLFYLLIVSAATFSYNCPFQTPLSLILRFLIRFDNGHKKYLNRTRWWFSRLLSRKDKNRSRPGGHGFGDHIEIPMANVFDQSQLHPLFNGETDLDDFVLDSNCITWMFYTSMDGDAAMAIMRFIPEVVWHAGIRITPLERIYDTVLERFDRSSGRLVLTPKLRDVTYLGAKALLHLAIQRKCVGNEFDKAIFKSISSRHIIMASGDFDSDLEVTLGIIDRVFGDFKPMHWQNFKFTASHHAWMGHILLYRAWDILEKGEPLPDDIREFVLYSLRLEPPPPATIVADCLFIVGLVLGIKLHIDDLLIVDKRWFYSVYIRYHTELNCLVTVAKSTLRSTESTRNSPRRSGTPPLPPTRSTVLWNPWNSLPRSQMKTSLKRATTCSTLSCRPPFPLHILRRRSGKPPVSPCTGPTNVTNFCH